MTFFEGFLLTVSPILRLQFRGKSILNTWPCRHHEKDYFPRYAIVCCNTCQKKPKKIQFQFQKCSTQYQINIFFAIWYLTLYFLGGKTSLMQNLLHQEIVEKLEGFFGKGNWLTWRFWTRVLSSVLADIGTLIQTLKKVPDFAYFHFFSFFFKNQRTTQLLLFSQLLSLRNRVILT